MPVHYFVFQRTPLMQELDELFSRRPIRAFCVHGWDKSKAEMNAFQQAILKAHQTQRNPYSEGTDEHALHSFLLQHRVPLQSIAGLSEGQAKRAVYDDALSTGAEATAVDYFFDGKPLEAVNAMRDSVYYSSKIAGRQINAIKLQTKKIERDRGKENPELVLFLDPALEMVLKHISKHSKVTVLAGNSKENAFTEAVIQKLQGKPLGKKTLLRALVWKFAAKSFSKYLESDSAAEKLAHHCTRELNEKQLFEISEMLGKVSTDKKNEFFEQLLYHGVELPETFKKALEKIKKASKKSN